MNRFRAARERAHLSQKTASLSIGVKPPSMSAWETGAANPSLDNLVAMAALYNVSVDYLLGVDPDGSSSTGPAAGAGQDAKKEPAVSDGELRSEIVSRIQSLPDPALVRVGDFLAGLEAGQAIGAAEAAGRGQDAEPVP